MQRLIQSPVAILAVSFLIACGCRQGQNAENESANAQPAAESHESTTQSQLVQTSGTQPKETLSNPNANPPVPEMTETASKSSSIPEATDSVSAGVPETVSENQTRQHQEPEAQAPPASVAQAAKVLDLAGFPKPRGAKNHYLFQSSLFYDAPSDRDTALVYVTDEMLKRGFAERNSFQTRMATVTLKKGDRPMTIYLANSLGANLTHVTLYNHQGVETSDVPQIQAIGPIDQRVDQVFYQSRIGVREGQQILRTLAQEKNLPLARMSSANGKAKVFEKDGINVVVHVETSEQMEFENPEGGNTKTTRVSIFSRGNVAVSELPRPESFGQTKQAYTSIFGSAKYFIEGDALSAAQQAAKAFQDAGWKKIEPIRQGIADTQDLFMKNGTLVQIQAAEFENNRAHVDYSLSLLPIDLPADIETRIVRVDTAAPHLFFSTTADVNSLREFYTQHLPAVGWTPDESNRKASSAQFMQLYHGSYHQPVVLDIQSKGPQSTWVELKPVDLATVARMFRKSKPETDVAAAQPKQMDAAEAVQNVESVLSNIEIPETPEQIEALARKKMDEALGNLPAEQAAELRKLMNQQRGEAGEELLSDPDDSPEVVDEAEASAHETSGSAQAGKAVPDDKIAADAFPIPAAAENISRDFEMITFRVNEIKKNAQFLSEQLAELQWKTRGEQIIESDLGMLRFQKGVGTINVSMTFDDRREPPVHVVAQGDGLWFPESAEFGAAEEEMDGAAFEDDSGFDGPEVQEFEGLALPKGIESPFKTRSQFRSEFVTSVEGDLKSIHEFFRNSAAETEWKIKSEKLSQQEAVINLASDRGELTVELKRYEGEIEINLAIRDPKVAGEQGMVPPAGKARLLLANIAEVETTIVINGKSYKLAPEQGANDPKDSLRIDVEPGDYNYSIKAAGREEQSDKLAVTAGGTWAIVVIPEQGHMAERMY